jgi:SAM-dependent methyltransferase
LNKVNACPVCGGGSLRVVQRYNYRSPITNGERVLSGDSSRVLLFFEHVCPGLKEASFEIALCDICGFLFQNPRFTLEEIVAKYRALERQVSSGVMALLLKQERRSQRVFHLLSSMIGPCPKPLRVLDYGGGTGCMLESFVAAGHSCELLDYQEHSLPNGVKRLGRDLDDLSPDDQFDVILLSHVLEHVIDPVGLLQDLRQRLVDGGLLYVEIPLGAFLEWETLGEPLTHINFFSEESTGNALNRAGFSTIHLGTRFQWLHRRRSWCINAIGRKSEGGRGIADYKTTLEQMRFLRYYLPLAFREPNLYGRRLVKTIINRSARLVQRKHSNE